MVRLRNEAWYLYRCARLGSAFFKRRLIHCNLQVTYRCNFDCSMCCQHIPEYAEGLPGFPIPGEQSRELPTARWKGILDDIAASFPIHFGHQTVRHPGFIPLPS